MRKFGSMLFFLMAICVLANSLAQAQSIIDLTNAASWYFKEANKAESQWLQAKVPGTIHQDLLAHQLIADPYLLNNEQQAQWPAQKEWLYQTTILLTPASAAYQQIELVFEGLDTDAEILINGKVIASVNNMFRIWKFNVRPLLKIGSNDLQIKFLASENLAALSYHKLQPKIPLDERIMVRKAAYQFGWDWGPRLVTAGVYKKVYLHCWDNLKIEHIQYQQLQIDTAMARLNAKIAIHSQVEQAISYQIIDSITKQVYASSELKVLKGQQFFNIPFAINKPKLWWSNGLGAPNLLNLTFILLCKNIKIVENTRIGLRKIELVQQADQKGKSFYFKLNGVPVFMKGANYIPQDNFIPRVSSAQTKTLIQQAKAANFNMLRVWGGGIYESDAFYNECDESGILVWQDFMFACGLVPGGAAFANNVKQEIADQLIRLRNHPCIALWCGNNEVAEGWSNWGWQKQFNMSAADSIRIWSDYQKIFHQIIPSVIDSLSDGIAYWPSSPQFGWGRKESLLFGDIHYWGVWWGEEPFEKYQQKVGRFVSEYGFQSFPNKSTLEKFTNLNDRKLNSSTMQAHQKHPKGFQIIDQQMALYYQKPSDFDTYAYTSQVLQAEGLKIAIEAHRMAMPYCMGTLYWQFNDCWPVVSWSSSDYYQDKKAAYYFVKKSFATNLLAFKKQNDSLQLYVVSDSLQAMQVKLNFKVMTHTGKIVFQSNNQFNLRPQSATKLTQFSMASLTKGFDPTRLVGVASIEKQDGSRVTNYYYFDSIKNLDLVADSISVHQSADNGQIAIRISSPTWKKNIQLSTSIAGEFSDNYFDLLPNQTQTIYFKPTHTLSLDNIPLTTKFIYNTESKK
jgi:beta-mannosidase